MLGYSGVVHPTPRMILLKRVSLELGRVFLAKYFDRDPYGMLFRDRSWREAIPATYRGHRDYLRDYYGWFR